MTMKVCVIQPHYSTDFADADKCFADQLALLELCDDSMDLIVCPEACDVPVLAKEADKFHDCLARFHDRMMEAARNTAIRCHAMVFICGYDPSDEPGDHCGWRNTTFTFDRAGNIAGKYNKQHLTPGESSSRHLDDAYSFRFTPVTVVEMEGLRFGFLTCYDFYFYENFPQLARQNLDFIIGCSHQRSDTHEALALMSRFCAYNTNAYVVRSSVSMDEDSDIGGCSMIVSPDGTVIANLYSRIGIASAEIDPAKKYYKPAGYGNPPSAHHEYVEKGRRPWKYRPAGPSVVRNDDAMPYPRVCAHRGFSTAAPENSLPAFGAAVSLGAEEIEFDLWYTADGEIVSVHDRKLNRVSDGEGFVDEKTYDELLQYNFGVHDPVYDGMKILRFEEILAKFACRTVMNIHLKTPSNKVPWKEEMLKKVIRLIDDYDCRRHVYFMTGNEVVLDQLRTLAPDITRCAGGGDDCWAIVDRALAYDCRKVQLVKGKFNQEMIDRAHANGIFCNVFWSDDPDETRRFLDMGIDCILANNYLKIAQTVKAHAD